MKRFFLILFLFFAASFLQSLPKTVLAASPQCDCYCKGTKGPELQGKQPNPDTCKLSCESNSLTYLECPVPKPTGAVAECPNCVCGDGNPQGATATQQKCVELCSSGKQTFKSCSTKDAKPGTDAGALPVAPTPAPAPAPPPPTPTTCDCWCSTKDGAMLDPKSGKTTPDKCAKSCAASGNKMAACAFKVDQTPERNPYCFTEKVCAKQKGLLDKKQAKECVPKQSYCYPDPKYAVKTELSVSIPNPLDKDKPLVEVSDFGDYINAIVKWMLGIGFVIVVVLIMVGGLQYVLGAASPDLVKKGKTRMTNAIQGFVLLLCSYVILYSVNPYLVNMKIPQYPMIKRVDLIENAKCEDFIDEYKLQNSEGKDVKSLPASERLCGKSATIVSKNDGGSVIGANTCDFKTCEDKTKGCLGTGANAKCLKCSEVVPAPSIEPSSEVCGTLKPADTNFLTGENKDVKIPLTVNQCFYTHDPTVILTGQEEVTAVAVIGGTTAISGGLGGIAAVGTLAPMAKKLISGACAEMNLNCNVVRAAGKEGCGAYDDAPVISAMTANDPSKIENFFYPRFGITWSDYNLKMLCEANPCGVKFYNKDGGVVDNVPQTNVCRMNPGLDYSLWDAAKNDCVQAGSLELAKPDTSVKKEGVCDASTCKAPSKCIQDVNGNNACVKSCGELINGNTLVTTKDGKKAPLIISDTICTNFSVKPTGAKNSLNYKENRCLSTKDSNMLANFGSGNKACAEFVIDCSVVEKTSESDKCRGYDDLLVSNDQNKNVKLDDVTDRFNAICSENSCGVTGKNGKGCEINTTGNDCVSK